MFIFHRYCLDMFGHLPDLPLLNIYFLDCMAMFDLVCWNNGTVSDQPRFFNVMFWKTPSCGWLNYIKFLFSPYLSKNTTFVLANPLIYCSSFDRKSKRSGRWSSIFPTWEDVHIICSYVHHFSNQFQRLFTIFPICFFPHFHHYSHIFRGVSPCFPAISKDFPHVSQQFQRISPMFPSNFKGFSTCFPYVSHFPMFPSHFPFWRPLHHLRSK